MHFYRACLDLCDSLVFYAARRLTNVPFVPFLLLLFLNNPMSDFINLTVSCARIFVAFCFTNDLCAIVLKFYCCGLPLNLQIYMWILLKNA
jgi:hypothetical protein